MLLWALECQFGFKNFYSKVYTIVHIWISVRPIYTEFVFKKKSAILIINMFMKEFTCEISFTPTQRARGGHNL